MPSSASVRVVRGAAAVLVVIGIAAAIGRATFVSDFGARLEPARADLMDALQRSDPRALERPAEIAAFDERFGAHPSMTLLHVLPGAGFLLLAPLQFSSRIRRRYPRVHRWTGRLLLAVAVVGTVTGLYFGILVPFAGWGERVAIVLFGSVLLASIVQGYVAIRRRQVALHREWMIRVFALAIAISTVRIVAAVLDFALTPAGVDVRRLLTISMWTGWLITLAAAEGWIRHTRPIADRRGTALAVMPDLVIGGRNDSRG